MMRQLIILILSVFIYVLATAQEVTNVWFEQVGNNIQIYYTLKGEGNYTIEIYCKTDLYNKWDVPLKEVIGEVGPNVISGKNNVIIWNVLKERDVLSGEIQFRIEVKENNHIKFGSFIDDRDRKEYKTVRIEEQIWMAENLNYKKRNSWCFNNKVANCKKYGRLYDWKTAMKACPNGWHIPSAAEWDNLVDYLGGSNVAGSKMKETGTTHWNSPNTDATNESGFTALPSGFRSTVGYFNDLGNNNGWWSATEYSSSTTAVWTWILYNDENIIDRKANNKEYGFSVRCLRD